MAARFLVAVALFALCHCNPVIINGVLYRDARGFSSAQGYSSNFGGLSQASGSATANGAGAQAYGSGSIGPQMIARNDGFEQVYPGQAIAKAEAYEAPAIPMYGAAKAVAQAQNGAYYPVPEPATVITYEQNFEVPAEVSYEIPAPISAQSSAIMNGNSDSSIASAISNGAGLAQSSSQTQRGVDSYGLTSSNVKSFGGYGAADSTANTGYGSAITAARIQGLAGSGSASSKAHSGLGSTLSNAQAQMNGGYGSASSTANTGAYEPTIVAAKTQKKHISWRFGTLYDTPSSHAQAQANTNGFGAAKSTAQTYEPIALSGYNSANANANVNGAGLAKSQANVLGNQGSALSSANIGSGYTAAKSTANNGAMYGGLRSDANAHSSGLGSAISSAKAQELSTGYKITNSAANVSGYGSANAKSYSA
ncbi:mucin-21-like [Plodia interpunctella]|uniref:mucin-21-like n=1 Tax=Plodia interpunctella TaxID=58824 RepID=UPI0023686604|nr:mucin-21-like [Plodia interpunctella]